MFKKLLAVELENLAGHGLLVRQFMEQNFNQKSAQTIMTLLRMSPIDDVRLMSYLGRSLRHDDLVLISSKTLLDVLAVHDDYITLDWVKSLGDLSTSVLVTPIYHGKAETADDFHFLMFSKDIASIVEFGNRFDRTTFNLGRL